MALYFLLAPKSGAVQSFHRTNVAKDGLHGRHTMTVNFFTLGAIDSLLVAQ